MPGELDFLKYLLYIESDAKAEAKIIYSDHGPTQLNKYRALLLGDENSWMLREGSNSSHTHPKIILSLPLMARQPLSSSERNFFHLLIKHFDVYLWPGHSVSLTQCNPVNTLDELINGFKKIIPEPRISIINNSTEITRDHIIIDHHEYYSHIIPSWKQYDANQAELAQSKRDVIEYKISEQKMLIDRDPQVFLDFTDILNTNNNYNNILAGLNTDYITWIKALVPDENEIRFFIHNFPNLTHIEIAKATPEWIEEHLDKLKNYNILIEKCPFSQLGLTKSNTVIPAGQKNFDLNKFFEQVLEEPFEKEDKPVTEDLNKPFYRTSHTVANARSILPSPFAFPMLALEPDEMRLLYDTIELNEIFTIPGNFYENYAHIRRLVLRKCEISQLDIKKLPNLEELVIIDCAELEDIKLLDAPNLISLHIYGQSKIQDIWLAAPKLEHFSMISNTTIKIVATQSNLVSFRYSGITLNLVGAFSNLVNLDVICDKLEAKLVMSHALKQINIVAINSKLDAASCTNLRSINISAHNHVEKFGKLADGTQQSFNADLVYDYCALVMSDEKENNTYDYNEYVEPITRSIYMALQLQELENTREIQRAERQATFSNQELTCQANKRNTVSLFSLEKTHKPHFETGDKPISTDASNAPFSLTLLEEVMPDRSEYRLMIFNKILFDGKDIEFVAERNPKDYIIVNIDIKNITRSTYDEVVDQVFHNENIGAAHFTGKFYPGEEYPLGTKYAHHIDDLLDLYCNYPIIVKYYKPEKQFYAVLDPSMTTAKDMKLIYTYNRNLKYLDAFTQPPNESKEALLPDGLIKLLYQTLNKPNDDRLKHLQFIFDKNLSKHQKINKLIQFCHFDLGKLKSSHRTNLDFVLATIIEHIGVCQHRSQAFMLLSHLIDVPACFMRNENHMVAEIPVGDDIYQIDLGGGPTIDLTPEEKRQSVFKEKLKAKKQFGTKIFEEKKAEEKYSPEEKSLEQIYYQHIKKFVTRPNLISFDKILKPRTGLTPLLEAASGEQLKAVRARLVETCQLRKLPYLYINSARDIYTYLNPYVIKDNQRKQISGPLKSIIDDGGVIIINWSNFSDIQLENFKSLIDTVPTLSGNEVNPKTIVIGLTNFERTISETLTSRSQSYSVSSTLLEVGESKQLQLQGKPLQINLHKRPDWEEIYSDISFLGHSVEMKDGPLLQAVNNKIPLTIINPPDDPEFHNLLQQINTEKRFYFNGKWQEVPQHFEINCSSSPVESDAKNIQVESQNDHNLLKRKIFYLNQHNWHECFELLSSDSNHSAKTNKGYLSEYKSGDTFYITESISDSDWQRLQASIKKSYQDKDFNFVLAPGVAVSAHQNAANEHLGNMHILISNDSDYCATLMHNNHPKEKPLLIDVSSETTFSDLIAEIKITPTKKSKNLDFVYQEKGLLAALKSGRRVILNGEISSALYQQLLPLLSDKPHAYINSKRLEGKNIKGSLYLCMPLSAKKHINPNQYTDIPIYFEDYKPTLGKDYALAKKIQQFYEIANQLPHRGIALPPKPELTYQNLTRMIRLIKDSRGLHLQNPIKGLFLYDYPKSSDEYVTLNVLGKMLFRPEDKKPAREDKLLRLLKKYQITAASVLAKNPWPILNCFNGAELTRIFGTNGFVKDLNDDIIERLYNRVQKLVGENKESKESKSEKSHVTKRENQLFTLLSDEHTPGIYIRGGAGVGKTHTVHALKDKAGMTVFEDEDNFLQWVETKSKKPIVLLLEEANLAKPGHWNFTKGAGRNPRVITYKNKEYKLSPQHKIIVTGNPEHFPGRHYHPVFQQYFETLHFKMPEDNYLLENILKPILGQRLNPYSQSLLAVYKLAVDLNPTGVYSIRDLESLARRFKLISSLAQNPEALKKSLFKASIAEFAGQFKTDTRRLDFFNQLAITLNVDQETLSQNQPLVPIGEKLLIHREKSYIFDSIRQNLQIREQALNETKAGFYKQVAVLEGEAGLGKSTLLEELLKEAGFSKTAKNTQRKYYVVSAGDKTAHETLTKAFHEGAAVIVNELNLDLSLEKLLIKLLSGKDPKQKKAKLAGFTVLCSQNSALASGRQPLSDAMDNRAQFLYMQRYSKEALQDILAGANVLDPAAYARAYERVLMEFPNRANTRTLYTSLEAYEKPKKVLKAVFPVSLFGRGQETNTTSPQGQSPRPKSPK